MLLCRSLSSSSRLDKCPASASTCSLKLWISFLILSKFSPRSMSSPSFNLLSSRRLKSNICSSSLLTREDLLVDLFPRPSRRDLASASADSIFSFKVANSLCNRTFSQSVSFTEEKSVPTLIPDKISEYRQNYIWSCPRPRQASIDIPQQNHPSLRKR